MADRPCALWRDTRNNRIYRVSADANSKVNLGTLAGAPAVEVQQALLNVTQSGWGDILSAGNSDYHAWLDSIPTVV